MRNEADLSPSALAHFVRGELASSLRSRKPYTVNLLLGGVDPITHKPSLYWLDYLAALAPVPYAAHGYAQYALFLLSLPMPSSPADQCASSRYYCLSILDKHHHPDITFVQGMKILTMCSDELKRRLPIDFKGMIVKIVTKDGIRTVEIDDEKIVRSA
jgi:20S proteasome subunit beta 4